MSQTQKKYLAASLVMHALLVVMLVVGPGFAHSRGKPSNKLPLITMVDPNLIARLTDDPSFGGGTVGPGENPLLPPSQPKPAPKPAPAPEKKPEPVKVEKVKPAPVEKPKIEPAKTTDKIDPEGLEAVGNKKKPEPKLAASELKMAKRKPSQDEGDDRAKEAAKARERARQARQAREAATQGALNNIQGGLSSSTTIQVSGGGGTGGPLFANYDQYVRSVYYQAWQELPKEIPNDSMDVEVKIIVSKNGDVTARISVPSGNSALDRSVRRALDRVPSLRPFPDGAKDEQRTYNIIFNLKAKGYIG